MQASTLRPQSVSLPLQGGFHAAMLGSRAYSLFASSDLDETRVEVGRAMKPHDLSVTGSAQRLKARMHHVSFGEVTLSRLAYGAQVDILPDTLRDFFLVQMPLSGDARIESGNQGIESTPALASVLSPDDPIRMRWSADNDQLMVRISRQRLERTLTAQCGRPVDKPVRFELGMAWRELPAWHCAVAYLVQCAEHGIDAQRQRLLCAQIEQLVATTLLSSQAHNHTHADAPRRTTVLPRHVRKVQDYLQAHAHEPLCADQLAELAGVSLRSLYAGFKTFCGTSPMQYLKQVRLERAHAELLNGADSVAGVALSWGFDHLGRFSAEYRKRYGVSPGETLRRRG
jgi:AraC-like DNA-binding protein